jgi:hypothetical protein
MHSENINELATALAKAQGELKPAVKNTTNTFYKSAYAALPEVMEACRAALSKHGLAVVQILKYDTTGEWLETMLIHNSGQWIKGMYPIRPVKNDPQGLGSAQTYARRYALMAMVGVVADDESDDDANLGSGKISPTTEAPVPNPKTIATQWANEQVEFLKKAPFKTLRELDEWHAPKREKIASVRAHNEAGHRRLIEMIQKKQADLTPMAVG